jgi:hypothetical protein
MPRAKLAVENRSLSGWRGGRIAKVPFSQRKPRFTNERPPRSDIWPEPTTCPSSFTSLAQL